MHRDNYRTACHLVHADSWGTDRIRVDHHGVEMMTIGPSNTRLAEVGISTAAAIFQCTMTVAIHDDRDTNPDLMGATLSIAALARDASSLFRAADEQLLRLGAEYEAIGGREAPRWRTGVLDARRLVRLMGWRIDRRCRATRVAEVIACRRRANDEDIDGT